jgi:hypothetical protein
MMKTKSSDDRYSKREAQRRFEAALQGARIAGYTPVRSIPKTRPKPQRKPRKKSKALASYDASDLAATAHSG